MANGEKATCDPTSTDVKQPLRVRVTRLPGTDDLPLPRYATPGSAGADLCAAVTEPVTVRMGEIALIPTGLSLEIPVGFEGQVRPRSGLALRAGLTLVNAPGTIDCDYRGEVKIIVTCLSKTPCVIERGERIAQLVIAPVRQATFDEADVLTETERGEGGFGHTGREALTTV
ncbi:MAG: dUTP diphosphatase [Planctomycetes bacterium]|jgi:dUTP pyrophosphatase|nr:dUTP diphosphatase [Planctomycetota bacterium]